MNKFNYNEVALKNLQIQDTSVLDRLVDYESAREAHVKKDHSQRDKRMSLKEAVTEFVSDGDIYTDSGFSYVRSANQALMEVVRQNKKDLQMIGSPNACSSFLIATGNVKYAHASYQGAEMRGYDRHYSIALKTKKFRILSDWSHGAMALGFKAAQLGLPGLFCKNLLGSDIINYNPYVRETQNIMRNDRDEVVFVPALFPDVSIIHVQKADKFGNGFIYGPTVNDVAMASAARKVILTAEEIVPTSEFRNNNKGVVIPFACVNAVVELPFGAIPGSCPGYYYWSRQWWEKYFRYAAMNEENMQKFLEYWLTCKDQYEFLDRLGGAKWIVESRRQTLAAEYQNEDDRFDFSYREWQAGIKPEDELYY